MIIIGQGNQRTGKYFDKKNTMFLIHECKCWQHFYNLFTFYTYYYYSSLSIREETLVRFQCKTIFVGRQSVWQRVVYLKNLSQLFFFLRPIFTASNFSFFIQTNEFCRSDRVEPDHIRQITIFFPSFILQAENKWYRISTERNRKHWSHWRKQLRNGEKKHSIESNEARKIYFVHSEASDGSIQVIMSEIEI